MSIFSNVHSDLDDVASRLELLVDKSTVSKVIADLHETVDALEVHHKGLVPVANGAFGASAFSAVVQDHADKAHEAIMETLHALELGLEHYVQVIKDLDKGTTETDELAAADLKVLTEAVDYTKAGDKPFAPSPGTPTTSEEG